MRTKQELKSAVDQLEENKIVVAGVAVEQETVRCMIDTGDDAALETVKDVARNHSATVNHVAEKDGHDVLDLTNEIEETMPWE